MYSKKFIYYQVYLFFFREMTLKKVTFVKSRDPSATLPKNINKKVMSFHILHMMNNSVFNILIQGYHSHLEMGQ